MLLCEFLHLLTFLLSINGAGYLPYSPTNPVECRWYPEPSRVKRLLRSENEPTPDNQRPSKDEWKHEQDYSCEHTRYDCTFHIIEFNGDIVVDDERKNSPHP